MQTTVDRLTDRYMAAYNDVPRWVAECMFMNIPDHVIFNDDLVFIFVTLTDETLEKIKSNPICIKEHDFIRSCYLEEGANIYIFKIFGKAKGFKSLIKRLQAAYEPRTISYHRDDLKRIHTVYQGELSCHGCCPPQWSPLLP